MGEVQGTGLKELDFYIGDVFYKGAVIPNAQALHVRVYRTPGVMSIRSHGDHVLYSFFFLPYIM